MKKSVVLLLLVVALMVSACSTYTCPTYSKAPAAKSTPNTKIWGLSTSFCRCSPTGVRIPQSTSHRFCDGGYCDWSIIPEENFLAVGWNVSNSARTNKQHDTRVSCPKFFSNQKKILPDSGSYQRIFYNSDVIVFIQRQNIGNIKLLRPLQGMLFENGKMILV